MYCKISTKLLLHSSSEPQTRWEMDSAAVPACHEDFELRLRDSWTQPCSQFTRCPSQETPGFLRDFWWVVPLNWFNEAAQVPCYAEPLAVCTSSCCPAQPLWKQPKEFGATPAYSGSHSAKDDSPESEESCRKVRCSSVGLGALVCHRTIFSPKACF